MTSNERPSRPLYEHPWAVRLSHWSTAVAITILTMSGLRILSAFPSFGPKIPERDLIDAIPKAVTLGGWLGGALRWHFTFMWIFAAGGLLYVISQLASGHYRIVVFTKRDIPGVWPMARSLLPVRTKAGRDRSIQRPAEARVHQRDPLWRAVAADRAGDVQARADVADRMAGVAGIIPRGCCTFVALCGFAAFIPGHLVMVALHGWDNFASMIIGWKRRPRVRSPRNARDDHIRLGLERDDACSAGRGLDGRGLGDCRPRAAFGT